MNLNVKNILKSQKIVKAPPSISYTHRALVLASIAEGISTLYGPLSCNDSMAAFNLCKEMGAEIEWATDKWIVKGVGGKLENDPNSVLDVRNSGNTLIISTALATSFKNDVIITGNEHLKQKPIHALIDALNSLGAHVDSINHNDKVPLHIYPGFNGGKVKLSGISSPFVPVILAAGALADNSVTVEIEEPLLSKASIDMSIDIFSKFGVKISHDLIKKNETEGRDNNCHLFSINPQKFIATDYVIEGDYSAASYQLGAIAISGGELTVKNLFKDSKQGNKSIINILRDMGVVMTVFDDAVKIESEGILNGIDIDLSNSPDLLPTVAVLGAFANGQTKIYNAEHAKFKETDRIAACVNELNKLGCDIKEIKDGLIINGGKIGPGIINSHKDSRLTLAFSLICLKNDIIN